MAGDHAAESPPDAVHGHAGQTAPPALGPIHPHATLIGRRTLLRRLSWATFWAFVAGMIGATVRFFFPRVLFEPPNQFKVGFPEDFTLGSVNTNYQKSHRIWIVREAEGIFAILAICTHLGCTPVWVDSENKFKCPCHGSGYSRDGINYEGPAPRPMEHVKVTMAPDGQILIDKSVTFRYERGEWGKPGSILKA